VERRERALADESPLSGGGVTKCEPLKLDTGNLVQRRAIHGTCFITFYCTVLLLD
jgi:hypothetical protein